MFTEYTNFDVGNRPRPLVKNGLNFKRLFGVYANKPRNQRFRILVLQRELLFVLVEKQPLYL